MTLGDLLSTLTNKNKTQVTVKGSNGVELISFVASGYEALEDSIENSEVNSWMLTGPGNAITVVIDTPTTTEAEG